MTEAAGFDLTGAPVHRVHLVRDGMSATILSYGAILQDLRIKGHDRSLVLGYPELGSYLTDPNYFGATIGRVANRISKGSAVIDGIAYQLDQNIANGHHIHGGANGTGQRCWRVLDHAQTYVILEDTLPDGHMGYPGTLTVQVRFDLLADQTLSVGITAQSDTATFCNFAHHSYFNLGIGPTITGHHLQVDADRYLVIDDDCIPTGEARSVVDTQFDFRAGIEIKDRAKYDHNMCLAHTRRTLEPVAKLSCPDRKTHMDIATTEPGLQVYTGHGIVSSAHAPFAGVALEPQGWPDAPSHLDFPSVALAPDETYEQTSTFRFSSFMSDS